MGKGLFTITMHPQMIGRRDRLLLLEGIIEYVKDKPGVHFTTMIDYCRKMEERQNAFTVARNRPW